MSKATRVLTLSCVPSVSHYLGGIARPKVARASGVHDMSGARRVSTVFLVRRVVSGVWAASPTAGILTWMGGDLDIQASLADRIGNRSFTTVPSAAAELRCLVGCVVETLSLPAAS